MMETVQVAEAVKSPPGVIGLDVAKDTLSLAWGSAPKARVTEIANTQSSIKKMLRELPQGTIVGLESTGSYHRTVCDLAFRQGFQVYLLNPKDVRHYGQAINPRAKTDVVDARVIASYVEKERHRLHPYQEASVQVERIRQLISRRSLLVEVQSSWRQHLGTERVNGSYKTLQRSHDGVMNNIDAEMDACFAAEPDLESRRKRLIGIPGVGPVISAALVATLARGSFTSADSFVGFIGLDLRVEDSGQHRGRRRLTKRGDSQLRCLLFTAAMSVCSRPVWAPYYQRALERGWSRTESLIIVARRIAQTAWSMDHHRTDFRADRLFRKPAQAEQSTDQKVAAPEPTTAEPPAAQPPAQPIVAEPAAPEAEAAPVSAKPTRSAAKASKPAKRNVTVQRGEPAAGKTKGRAVAGGRGSQKSVPKRNVTLQQAAGGDGDATAATL